MVALIAASIIAVAMLTRLSLRHTPPRIVMGNQRDNQRDDQRGFTLQTIIIMAVLVVVAVVASVVLIAINNNASDDLAESDGDLEARCGYGEIFDPQLHAAGHGSLAAHGGIKSSAIGCYQFCYIESNELFGLMTTDPLYPEPVIEFPGTDGNRVNTWWLRHSTERANQNTRHSERKGWLNDTEGVRYTVLPVIGPRHIDRAVNNLFPNYAVDRQEIRLIETTRQEKYEIRVDPSGEFCYIWNSDTEETVFRSTEIHFTPTTAPNGESICRPRRDNVPATGNCPRDPIGLGP